MRPLELVIQGFRSFEERVELNWRGRRLVGIVGPIGSGKTSILDAVAFALYGKTPVFERENKTLIRHGAKSARVELAFEVEDEAWRVIRVIRLKGTSQHALQKLDARGVGATVSEREREVNEKVQGLLGLDFQTFCRSVLLAQNRFAEFLNASPGDRDRVLKGVFGFERLDLMQAAARQRREKAEYEVRELQGRLGSLAEDGERLRQARLALEKANARVEQLENAAARAADLAEQAVEAERRGAEADRRRERLAELVQGLPPIDEANGLLDEAARSAALLGQREEEREAAAAELSAAEKIHAEVLAEVGSEGDLARGESRLAALRRAERDLVRWRERLVVLEKRAGETAEFVATARSALKAAARELRHVELLAQQAKKAFHRAEEKADAEEEERGGQEALEGARQDLQRLVQARLDLARERDGERRQRQRLQASEEALREAEERRVEADTAETATEEQNARAEAEVAAARDAVAAAERGEMALVLASELTTGTPCPVCGQEVGELPSVASSLSLEQAREALKKAKDEAQTAASKLRVQAAAAAAAREAVAAAEKRRLEDEAGLKAAASAEQRIAESCRQLEEALDRLPGDGPPEERLAAFEARLLERAAELTEAEEKARRAEDDRREAEHALALAREQESSAVRVDQDADQQLVHARDEASATERDAAAAREALADLLGDTGSDVEQRLADDRRRLVEAEKKLAWARARERSAQSAVDDARTAADQASRRQESLTSRLAAAAGQLGELLGQETVLSEAENGSRDLARHLAEEARAALRAAETDLAKATDEAAAARRQTAELLTALDVAAGDATQGFDRVLIEAQKIQARDAATVAELEGRLGRAREFEEDLARFEKRRDVFRQLADDLTASKFLRYLLEQERAALAALGSERFEALSEGRYRFSQDGTFQVVDLNNAGAERRAETLSGGETFLASLALALALAEKVTAGGGRLDAFFLDEGFGSLDPEHLDLALQGIEHLVNGSENRLVTVVSHVPEMRERLEDLIELDKDPLTGKTVVVRGTGL